MDHEQEIRVMQREYFDFLDDEADQGIYSTTVSRMLEDGQNRLIVDMVDLRKKNRKRAEGLLKAPVDELIAFQGALKEMVGLLKPELAKELSNMEFFVGLEGTFGSKHVSPRSLSSRFLGSLVCCDGIVTKCTTIKPKVVKSVHYCPATQRTMERRYTDLTSSDPFPSSASYPTKDEDGNPLETEYGLSSYKDHQIFSIQEMPEKAPAGQLPRSVDVMVEHSLVDSCKPGDRVQVVGEFRCLPSKQGNVSTGMFRSIILANNVITMSKAADVNITTEEFTKIRSFAKQNGRTVFDTLARSLAPSIHGHEYIKKALLCMLLGGTEKILPNGTRLRGDINILLIGDPSVAKSQLLRYVLGTAPRAVATTGRGSSGVGLTAAVTTDMETGDRRLEAGAMVLADRGVVCIDEFDKMTDADRTAIHEVMEQGRVTVSKAGIQAQLNARCSVLAAANPVYGRYDQYKTPMENIGLPDSLLSRFDCIFVMLDTLDADADRRIADHVLQVHRYKENVNNRAAAPETADSLNTASTQDENSEQDSSTGQRVLTIYEKNDVLRTKGSGQKILTVEFMKKYIHMAKMVQPSLTQEACEVIAEEYARLRSQDAVENDESNNTAVGGGRSKMARTQPVTARALETLIRLATAHAKARMSRKIECRDAYAAIDLVQFAYFKRVLEKEGKRRRAPSGGEAEGSESEDEAVEGTAPSTDETMSADPLATPSSSSAAEATRKKRRVGSTSQPSSVDASSASSAPVTLSAERKKLFKSFLAKMFQERRSTMLQLSEVLGFINGKLDTQNHSGPRFTAEEMDSAVSSLSDDNTVMVAGDVLHWI